MILRTFQYSQFKGESQEWEMEPLTIGSMTLLVGKNASGKSRTLNVLNGLARLLSGASKLTFRSGDYDVVFNEQEEEYRYELAYKDARVIRENYSRGATALLTRGEGGKGSLVAVKANQPMEFQTPDSELAVVNRRDSIQHPFFERLHAWGSGVRHFQFGTPLGKDHLSLSMKEKVPPFDARNTAEVVAVFRRGSTNSGDEFLKAIIADMNSIGYEITEIGVRPPQSLVISADIAVSVGELVGLYVKERNLAGITDQIDMSQGMFRALSVIVQLNYAQRSDQPSCILIDDIGEGLDFDRSCALIDLLIEKAAQTKVQLIMSTNDRFVMNRVPLQHWAVIHRDGSMCRFFTYQNSREKFESFKLTGLSNFDFFATDFVRSRLSEEVSNLR